jgi:hypothetical protein
MKCKIYDHESNRIFNSKILDEYDIEYYYCKNCGFLETEKPYWLDKAYKDPINIEDTGILRRNLHLRNMTSIIIYSLYDRDGKFLDYGGGHGIFTRLMRDMGYDFYWIDKYAENIFSRGFEYDSKSQIEAITCFESFEHFQEPEDDINKILKISRDVLFSTQLLPDPVPKPSDWWYYGQSHGQHISFYSLRTLKYIADTHKLNFYSFGDIHIFTEKKIGKLKERFLKFAYKLSTVESFRKKAGSKTIDDMNYVISLKTEGKL